MKKTEPKKVRKKIVKSGGAKAGKTRKRQFAPTDPETGEKGLTPAKETFATLIAKGEHQTEAYLTAFPQAKRWAKSTVHSKASTLAAEEKVRARITELLAKAAAANEVDVAKVLQEYMTRLRADPRELTEVRVSACRYCHGEGHRYQFTDGELEHKRAEHEAKRAQILEKDGDDPGPFNERGGGGYSRHLLPLQECPACGGDGDPRVVLKDSRNLSAGALALFGGVKQTKEGIEVKIGDRDAALNAVARHVGFFEADNKSELEITVNDEELDAIYEAAKRKAMEAQAAARGRMARIAEQLAKEGNTAVDLGSELKGGQDGGGQPQEGDGDARAD